MTFYKEYSKLNSTDFNNKTQILRKIEELYKWVDFDKLKDDSSSKTKKTTNTIKKESTIVKKEKTEEDKKASDLLDDLFY